MGKFISSLSNNDDNKISDLESRLKELEVSRKEADKDLDGYISTQEFHEWQAHKEIGYEEHLNELKKEIECLKTINHNLEQELQTEKEISSTELMRDIVNKSRNTGSLVSKQLIHDYVNKMLENPQINIGYMPDFVEKQMYKNVFNMMLNVLDHVLETTKVELMGHEIVFDMRTSDVSGTSEAENETNNENKQ